MFTPLGVANPNIRTCLIRSRLPPLPRASTAFPSSVRLSASSTGVLLVSCWRSGSAGPWGAEACVSVFLGAVWRGEVWEGWRVQRDVDSFLILVRDGRVQTAEGKEVWCFS